MNDMKSKKDTEYYIKRFQEIVCFLTAKGIKKSFKTLDEYNQSKPSSKAYCLHIDWELLAKLSKIDNKKCFEKLLEESKHLFSYHRHIHKSYVKSNKHFSRNSWFELTPETLELWFADEKNFNPKTCKLISKDTHKWIDKNIYANKHEEFKSKKPKSNIIPEEEDVFNIPSNIPDF
jgi:hypothetical protein